jgi:LysM repeat protein
LRKRSVLGWLLPTALAGGVLLGVGGFVTPRLAADTYEVQPGDSLSALAERFGVSQAVLRALNPGLTTADLLYVGQVLEVPNGAAATTRARQTHVVQAGETLSEIAARYELTLSELLALNPDQDPNVLWVGAELVVRDDFAPAPAAEPTEALPAMTNAPDQAATAPPPSPSPVAATGPSIRGIPVHPYRVQPGDTLTSIARNLRTTVVTLIVFNPSVRPSSLVAGTSIWAPVAGGSVQPRVISAPAPARTQPYTVVAGDSATSIAQRHGLTLAQLQALNDGASLGVVFVGQVLRIPAGGDGVSGGGAPSLPADLTTYTVRPGDSGYALADVFGLTLPELSALNPSVNFAGLQVGQVLTVPNVDLPPPPPGTVPAGPPPPNTYVVETGDNLTRIAEAAGTTTSQVLALNSDLDPNLLRVGQELVLPGTKPIPTVSSTEVVESGGMLEVVAARVGVLPHTLLANNPGLGEWVSAGTPLVVPQGEGVVAAVRSGDTLGGIAAAYGSSVERIAAHPLSGVIGANELIIGQEILIPIALPEFGWPVTDALLTDGFGECRTSGCEVMHRGTDMAIGAGTPVGVIAEGTVTFVGGSYCCGLGFHVEVQHDNGFLSRYGHLSGPPPVVVGQQLQRGDLVGYVGTTGFSTGPHLHLELEHNDWYLDALNYLP